MMRPGEPVISSSSLKSAPHKNLPPVMHKVPELLNYIEGHEIRMVSGPGPRMLRRTSTCKELDSTLSISLTQLNQPKLG
jgi:hypothetical protein